MTNIRRHWEHRQTVFLTHVTHKRQRLLVEHIDLLLPALRSTLVRPAFNIVAWVVLPDHLHLLLNYQGADVSLAMRRFKLSFSMSVRGRLGMRSGRNWQNRFWDHLIRDERDFQSHLDYIHYNPVKLGVTDNPHEYPHSSLGEFSKQGLYQPDWGVVSQPSFEGEFGE